MKRFLFCFIDDDDELSYNEGNNETEEVSSIAAKKYSEMTAEEKYKRREYAKARRKRIMQAAREAGIIGAPRPKMSDAERKAKRKGYNKDYRKRITAQAKAYRAMMAEK